MRGFSAIGLHHAKNAMVAFSAKTPFQLPGILEAQKQLINFLGVSEASVESLTLVGDAAAAVLYDRMAKRGWEAPK